MEKKNFLNGTELGSKREPATKASSAPDGAVTGSAKLDVTTFGDVSGGYVSPPRCGTAAFQVPEDAIYQRAYGIRGSGR